MDRKEFLKSTGTIILTLTGVSLVNACSDDPTENKTGTINLNVASNHGHNAIDMTAADVENGTIKTYTLSGGSHTHTFTPTAQNMADLKAGSTVMVIAMGTHNHDVTLTYVK